MNVPVVPDTLDSYRFAAEEWALAQYIADLPDPSEYALVLPEAVRSALATAYSTREGFTLLDPRTASQLRPYGLCDVPSSISNGRMLTAYGMKVRSVILEWMAA